MITTKEVGLIVRPQIDKEEILYTLMKKYGAFIAGGASHALMRGYCLQKYLDQHDCADLDLYFEDKQRYRGAVNFIEKLTAKSTSPRVYMEKSPTGLCNNISIENSFKKIQLVGCIFGKPESVILSFDFKNLESCLFLDGDHYKMMYTDNAKESKLLNIRHSNSPFLMHRVYKYMKYRGYTGVSKSSRRHITDWIIKASSGYYLEHKDGCPSIYVDLLNNNAFKSLLRDKDIISNSDLVFMIGKIKEDVHKSIDRVTWHGYSISDYKVVGQRDVVINEIKNRSKYES